MIKEWLCLRLIQLCKKLTSWGETWDHLDNAERFQRYGIRMTVNTSKRKL